MTFYGINLNPFRGVGTKTCGSTFLGANFPIPSEASLHLIQPPLYLPVYRVVEKKIVGKIYSTGILVVEMLFSDSIS